MDEFRKHVSTSALHDTSTRQGDDTTECHPKTRQRLLGELSELLRSGQSPLNWLYGPAGAGKTAIMRSLATLAEEQGHFLAGFHFWRSDSSRNTLKNFIATLLFQLAQKEPAALPLIKRALQRDALLLDKSRKTQMEKLIIEPLLACSANDGAPRPRCILIDGLDECDEVGQREFLEQLLPTLVSRLSSTGVTFTIASRSETAIENLFSHPRLGVFTNRIFLEPSPEDVREFLIAEFEETNRCYPRLREKYGGKWPSTQQLERLVEKSSGYFILCATAMRYINPTTPRGRPPDRRLDDVLDAVSADPLRPLDALYLFILRQNAPESPAMLDEWKRAIGLVCMPLDISTSGFGHPWNVFGDKEDSTAILLMLWYKKDVFGLEDIFLGLGSLVYFDKETGQPKAYHASFADFLFNLSRSHEFFVDAGLLHLELACIIIKLINHDGAVDPYMTSRLLTQNFSYHLERACLENNLDALPEAFDSINWSSSPLLATCLSSNPFPDIFSHVMHFFASIYASFEMFRQRTDVCRSSSRRQHMLSNLSKLVRAVIEDAPRRMDDPNGLQNKDLELLFVTWGALGSRKLPESTEPRYTLLHFHSTPCLLRWKFEMMRGTQSSLPCTRSSCLDDQELRSRPTMVFNEQFDHQGMDEFRCIFNMLEGMNLTGTIGDLLLQFFDDRLPLRCAHILSAQLHPVRLLGPDDDDNSDIHMPHTTVYLVHAAPLLQTLDLLWQQFFLQDTGRAYIAKWKPFCLNWRTSDNPVHAFRVKQILQYLNRCLRGGLVPTIVAEIRGMSRNPNFDEGMDGWLPKEKTIHLPEVRQQEMWSKYSALVLDEPSFPQVISAEPTSIQTLSSQSTASDSDLLSTSSQDDVFDSNSTLARREDSSDSSLASSISSWPTSTRSKRSSCDTEEETDTTPLLKKKKLGFWNALALGR